MSGFNTLKGSGGGGTGEGLAGGAGINPFGSLNVAELTPTAQATFVYGLNTSTWLTSSTGNSSAVTVANNIVTCSSGISTSGSAEVRLCRGMKYRAGQGGVGKFTAIFDPGVANNTQIAGLGNTESGYYFARQGTNFGILHVDSSKKEIRKLTINAAAGTETVTVTLNGVAISFSITGGSLINQTSHQISIQDFSQVGHGWDAEAIDGTVYFVSRQAQNLNGTYSFSSLGTATGTFSTIQSGAAAIPTFISQSSWNIDRLDGSQDGRVILDPSKGNVYSIGYQYLGFGNAIFSVEDENKGILVPVHQIKNANVRNSVVLSNPHVFMLWNSTNSGSSTSVDIKGGSGALFTEGIVNRNIGPTFATGSYRTGVQTTPVPILTIRPNKVFKNQTCYGEIDPFNISVGADFNAAANTDLLNVLIYKNLTLTGPVNFSYVDQNNSIVACDIAATGFTITSNSKLMKSFSVPANNAVTLQLNYQDFFLSQREKFTIVVSTTGNTANVAANISWFEDQ